MMGIKRLQEALKAWDKRTSPSLYGPCNKSLLGLNPSVRTSSRFERGFVAQGLGNLLPSFVTGSRAQLCHRVKGFGFKLKPTT